MLVLRRAVQAAAATRQSLAPFGASCTRWPNRRQPLAFAPPSRSRQHQQWLASTSMGLAPSGWGLSRNGQQTQTRCFTSRDGLGDLAKCAREGKIWVFDDVQRAVKEAKTRLVIVDVREPSELMETGKIPKAVNIPIDSNPDSFYITDDEFEARFGFSRPGKHAETELLIYCRSGVRAKRAANLARKAGWKEVGEYSGSWLDWLEKGGQVER